MSKLIVNEMTTKRLRKLIYGARVNRNKAHGAEKTMWDNKLSSLKKQYRSMISNS